MSASENLTIAEVKEILEEEESKRELTTEQKYALQHAKVFAKSDGKKAKEIMEQLKAIEPLNASHACKLADTMPQSAEEVRAVFAKERFTLDDSAMNQILSITKDE